MRGKHFSPRAFSPIPRTIPARTGYAARKLLRKSCIWTYPLTCGANEGFWEQARLGADISPLMRGKPPIAVVIQPGLGLTPAYAGYTSDLYGKSSNPSNNPRAHGVHSSRAMRSSNVIRTIPAHAGYTLKINDIPAKLSPVSGGPDNWQPRTQACLCPAVPCRANKDSKFLKIFRRSRAAEH